MAECEDIGGLDGGLAEVFKQPEGLKRLLEDGCNLGMREEPRSRSTWSPAARAGSEERRGHRNGNKPRTLGHVSESWNWRCRRFVAASRTIRACSRMAAE